jgi:thioesterase domain-containing protein
MEAKRVRIAWIMGWAVPPSWFAAQVRAILPEAAHVFFEPTESAIAALETQGPFECVVGYSLGAHLLLAEAARVTRLGAKVVLLAPFIAFPSEEAMGGRVARTQVRYLVRWVRRERDAALADFYAKAGLDVSAEMAADISAETLAEGLMRLEKGRVEMPVPSDWGMFVGDRDDLLDALILAQNFPTLVVVPGATHHPAALLRAWKEAGI